jgi:taurine transport system ATP-binding protein
VRLDGVQHVFGHGADARAALAHVDVDLAPGELVALVGPSGCGKSTALGLVAGFLTPSRGRVTVDDVPVTSPGVDRGVVFQQPRLFPWLSVRRNVELGPQWAGASKATRRAAADEVLALVGLEDVADRAPYELSGGMQQRAAIARALAGRPRVLLMDEPFAALDALTRERLQEELLRVWRATGTTILFVTHSVDEAAYLGTRALAFSASPGRVVLDLRLRALAEAESEPLGPDGHVLRARADPRSDADRDRLREAVRGAAA